MLRDKQGLTIVEYIVGGALMLAILGLSAWALSNSVSDQGTATRDAVDAMPAQPTW